MWILFLVKPYVSINGHAQQLGWGKHSFDLPPGQHQVEAWFPYILKKECCKGGTMVSVAPGASYKLRYRPAWLMFLPGSMKLVEQPQLPVATAL